MKNVKRFLLYPVLCILCFTALRAQNAIPVTGGNASGSGGSVSYSVGQIFYHTFSGTNGSAAEGVQQPYEISVISAVENTGFIDLVCTVYPNPSSGVLKLIIETPAYQEMRFRLFTMNGVLLQDKKVRSKETEISLEGFTSSIYILKVLKDNLEVKVFKIIKR